jgi:dUTPase
MITKANMAVEYTLELFPTEGNWDAYVSWFGGSEIERNNDNAGVDLYCVKDQTVGSMRDACLLDLGVKARMTKTWKSCQYGSNIDVSDQCHFWLAPRSSIWKSNVRQANSLGVIDRSYRGVLMGAVLLNSSVDTKIDAGTRLFQVLAPDMGYIKKVVLKPLSELDETARGDGGFGSTGK